MQWILMVLGILLGAASDLDSGWALGGLFGLALGQGLRLNKLDRKNAELHDALLKVSGTVKTRLAEFDARLPGGPQEAPTTGPAEPAATAEAEEAPVNPWFAPEPPSPRNAVEIDNRLPQGEGYSTPLPEPSPPRTLAEAVTEPVAERGDARQTARVDEPVTAQESFSAAAPREPEAPAWLRQAQPAEPAEPGLIERAFQAARDWLFGGNTVLRMGALLLFLGLAFLLRYAAERVVVPVELRYAGVALTAMALLGLGWRLRTRNAAYALMLQGTGIGVMYLTLFAAMRLHPLLPPGLALALMVLVTIASAILAVLQDAVSLAAAAALGGFAAPILTSTGGGNHVALFSYFLLLNSGILAIAWFKAWRSLNLIGFFGTFGIGFAWGIRSYQPELLASTEPFLIAFFLMYVAIGLLFARRTLQDAGPAPEQRDELLAWSARQANYVDGTVLFGPPLIGFGLQYALISHLEFGAAFSALGLGLFYGALARLLAGRFPGRVLLLVETCIALAVIFGTLAVPLALDARWTAAAWAVEGAGIFWLGLRQRRPLARTFALLLQLAAGLDFLGTLHGGTATLLDGAPLGALLMGCAWLFSERELRLAPAGSHRSWEAACRPILACGGLGFLYLTAPLLFALHGTVICWALAGLATLWAGLKLASRAFLLSAFAVQLLGGAVFLLNLRHGHGIGALDSGWLGLVTASLLGLALIGGMLLASRDRTVRADDGLMKALAWVLLAGLVFVNLAVLFVLPWHRASPVWAGSGLLILWLGMKLRLLVSCAFGILLQIVGGVSFLIAGPGLLADLPAGELTPLAHGGFWTPAVLALAAFAGAWRLFGEAESADGEGLDEDQLRQASTLLLIWSAGWWLMTWIPEAARFVPAPSRVHLLLAVAAATVAFWTWVAERSRWPMLALLTLTCPALAIVGLIHDWGDGYHLAAHWGWLGWPALVAAYYWALYRLPDLIAKRTLSHGHVLGCWLMLGLASLELRHLLAALAETPSAWHSLGWALLPSAYLLAMASPKPLPAWPLEAHRTEYRRTAATAVAVLLLAWFWWANAFNDGRADPLPYLPLVNPLELGLLLALFAIHQWSVAMDDLRDGFRQSVAGASLLALLTWAVFRAAHHWAGIAFHPQPLLDSMLVQASLSILWTVVALGLMLGGHRLQRRELWMSGAVLIGVVVVKLFLVELGNRGGLARIVSFIAVGVLLLVVGYFAPLPPRRPSSSDTARPLS
jgi:uncharacterized membrane protein